MIKQILYLIVGLLFTFGIVAGIMYAAIRLNDWLDKDNKWLIVVRENKTLELLIGTLGIIIGGMLVLWFVIEIV